MYKNAGKFFNRSRSSVVQDIRIGAGRSKKLVPSSNQSVSTATWAKLRDGSWGLRVTGDCSSGMKVKVVTRDGRVSEQVVGEILGKSGDNYTCTLADKTDLQKFATRPKRSDPAKTYPIKPIPPDDGTIPFDPPYIRRRKYWSISYDREHHPEAIMQDIPIGLITPKVFKAIEAVCKHGLSYSDNHAQVKAAVSNLTMLLQQETSEVSVEVVALRNLLRRAGGEHTRPALRLDPIQELGTGSYPVLDSTLQEAALNIKQIWSSFGRYLNASAKNLEANGSYRGRALDPLSVMSDEVAYLWKSSYVPWFEKAKKTFIGRSGINEAEVTLMVCVEAIFPHQIDTRFSLKKEASLSALKRQLQLFADQ